MFRTSPERRNFPLPMPCTGATCALRILALPYPYGKALPLRAFQFHGFLHVRFTIIKGTSAMPSKSMSAQFPQVPYHDNIKLQHETRLWTPPLATIRHRACALLVSYGFSRFAIALTCAALR
jgi:hypothetical protein